MKIFFPNSDSKYPQPGSNSCDLGFMYNVIKISRVKESGKGMNRKSLLSSTPVNS